MSHVRRVEKPWGHEIIWAHAESYVGKILHVKAGEKLSWQYHEEKEETIYLYSGLLDLETETEDEERHLVRMFPGDAFHIEPLRRHRMIAVEDCDIIEASSPHLDDVIRLEDSYGREGTSDP